MLGCTSFLFTVLFLITACGTNDVEIDRYLEDGVEVVVNHLIPYRIEGETTNFSLEEELVLDTEGPVFSELEFGDLFAGDVDSEGNIYLLSGTPTSSQIFKFDKYGEFIQQIGKPGQGPGEMQQFSTIRVMDSDRLTLYDSGSVKFLIFNPDGSVFKEIKKTSPIFSFLGECLDNGNYLVRARHNDDKGLRHFHYVVLDPNFEKLKDLDPTYFIVLPNESQRKVNLVRGYGIFTGIRAGRIVMSANTSDDLEILIYDYQGTMLKKIKKEYTKVRFPNDLKEEYLKRWRKNPMWEKWNLEKSYYFPDHFAPFKALHVDDDGRILLETYESYLEDDADHVVYHIFNREGIFIGIQKLAPADARIFKNGRMYSMRSKEDGYAQLIVKKITWY
jgi:hypothetical protein